MYPHLIVLEHLDHMVDQKQQICLVKQKLKNKSLKKMKKFKYFPNHWYPLLDRMKH